MDLDLLFKKINKRGFKIYQFLNKFKKDLKKNKCTMFPGYYIPDEVLLPLMIEFDRQYDNIEAKFPWLTIALRRRIEQWWVTKQIERKAIVNRNSGEVVHIKIVLDNMLKEGGRYEKPPIII